MTKNLRLHQSEIVKRSQNLNAGERKTIAHVTPGGGKTGMGSLLARELLDSGKINRVVWVCPRTSLTKQVADGFRDPYFNPKYSIRRTNNIPPLFRDVDSGKIGYVTTYQSIAAKPNMHLNETKGYKYLLILDEPHHLQDSADAQWLTALEPIADNATHLLLMTGTIERHDNKPIPFIDYEQEGKSLFPKKDIIYTRFDALVEKAIIPIEFIYENGWTKFEDSTGLHEIEIAKATDAEVSKVIQTFLSKTEFRDRILRRSIQHWLESRKAYPSRAIIICATQKMARDIEQQVNKEFDVKTALAISDDPNSVETIENFRKGVGDILITVGMAYEGLDVPDCKHLICLTDTRSIPWLEQAFARVTRVDYTAIKNGFSYNKQRAYIFVPDDPRMRRVVDQLRDEQDRGIKEQKAKIGESIEREMDFGTSYLNIIGATSSGTTTDSLSVDFTLDDSVDLSLSETEEEKRRKIEVLARRRDILKRLPKGSTNKLIFKQFKTPRAQMSISELTKVLNYLNSLLQVKN